MATTTAAVAAVAVTKTVMGGAAAVTAALIPSVNSRNYFASTTNAASVDHNHEDVPRETTLAPITVDAAPLEKVARNTTAVAPAVTGAARSPISKTTHIPTHNNHAEEVVAVTIAKATTLTPTTVVAQTVEKVTSPAHKAATTHSPVTVAVAPSTPASIVNGVAKLRNVAQNARREVTTSAPFLHRKIDVPTSAVLTTEGPTVSWLTDSVTRPPISKVGTPDFQAGTPDSEVGHPGIKTASDYEQQR